MMGCFMPRSGGKLRKRSSEAYSRPLEPQAGSRAAAATAAVAAAAAEEVRKQEGNLQEKVEVVEEEPLVEHSLSLPTPPPAMSGVTPPLHSAQSAPPNIPVALSVEQPTPSASPFRTFSLPPSPQPRGGALYTPASPLPKSRSLHGGSGNPQQPQPQPLPPLPFPLPPPSASPRQLFSNSMPLSPSPRREVTISPQMSSPQLSSPQRLSQPGHRRLTSAPSLSKWSPTAGPLISPNVHAFAAQLAHIQSIAEDGAMPFAAGEGVREEREGGGGIGGGAGAAPLLQPSTASPANSTDLPPRSANALRKAPSAPPTPVASMPSPKHSLSFSPTPHSPGVARSPLSSQVFGGQAVPLPAPPPVPSPPALPSPPSLPSPPLPSPDQIQHKRIPSLGQQIPANLQTFTFAELRAGTGGWAEENLLGEGGFGKVYKGQVEVWGAAPGGGGVFAAEKVTVAVKRLNREGLQGQKEWLAEVNYLGNLNHPHLVQLIGYCNEDNHWLLVYEFVENKSLEHNLFKPNECHGPLPWMARMRVALDAAKGLAHLHEELEHPVIFRDFKAANVLLDKELHAKLSDFGLARAGPEGDVTHVSTQVVGTVGYAAPEYVLTGHLTSKSDVWSYGVVLVELLTGRRSMDERRPKEELSLIDWARPFLAERWLTTTVPSF